MLAGIGVFASVFNSDGEELIFKEKDSQQNEANSFNSSTHFLKVSNSCKASFGLPTIISLYKKGSKIFWLYLFILPVFHLPARPARISHKIRRGRKVLKDARPPDACFFRLASPVSKKILLFRLLSRDFTAPELFTITPAYWYPASASRLFAKILTTECQSH